jgi:transcription antitermination factor NusG
MILKLNKGRHEAVVGLPMFGTTVPVSVGIEIIEKV